MAVNKSLQPTPKSGAAEFQRYMNKTLLSAFLLLPLQGQAEVSLEVAFLGNLEKLVLIPRDRPGCPEPVAPEGQIVVSNHCGCGTATFRITSPVVPLETEQYQLNYRIGEWCKPNMNLFQGAEFLVFKAEGLPHRWIEAVETEDGKPGFYSEQLDLLFYELELEPTDLDFGPEIVEICENSEETGSCEAEPVVLAEELLEVLHITSRSSTFRL